MSSSMALFSSTPTTKSVLVSELAIKGHMSDALAIFDEMRKNGENLEPQAVLLLIQHGQDECKLHRLLELLYQLEDHDLWVKGCDLIISFCIRHKLLCSTYDLLKQRVQDATDAFQINDIFVGAIAEIANMKPTDIQFGINLLRAMKEDLRIGPPRPCLDILLAASGSTKEGAGLVWKEYELAGLPCNVLTYLMMHKALLASGQHEQAKLLLENIPRDILGSYSL